MTDPVATPTCPLCGNTLVEREDDHGQHLVCVRRDCQHTEPVEAADTD